MEGTEGVVGGRAYLEVIRREVEMAVVDLEKEDEFGMLTTGGEGGKVEFMLDGREKRGAKLGSQLQCKQLDRLKRAREGG